MGDPYKPLMNRAIQAELAPGSTFQADRGAGGAGIGR